MRVLALVTDAWGGRGGIAKFNRDMLTSVGTHPNVTEVVALPRVVSESVTNIPAGIRFDTGSAGSLVSFGRAVVSAAIRGAYDVVFCAHINLLPFGYLAARRRGVPLLMNIHGVDAWQPTSRSLTNRLINHVDRVVSVSDFTRQRFCDWSGLPEDRVSVLPNCIEEESFGVGPKPEYLLDRYDIHGRRVLLTVGRMSPLERYKGFDEILEVYPRLLERYEDLVYLICGDGEDRQRLVAKARALGLQDRVIFAGYIPEEEKQDHYRVADAFAMPGRGEGFGIVYLEALASGIPVVASKLDASREAVMEGLLGEVVDPDDPADLIRGISAALDRGAGTVPRELSHFSFESFKSRWHHLLDEWLFNEEPAASVKPGAPAAVYDSI